MMSPAEIAAKNGIYLARYTRYYARPVNAFREYIFKDVLSVFGNLSKRAKKVENDYFRKMMADLGPEVDPGDYAEQVIDHAVAWYELMASLRQGTLNMLAAGLHHLVEQQLTGISRDALFRFAPPLTSSKIDEVTGWYKQNAGIRFNKLKSWPVMRELHLVANVVKHGEIEATKHLRKTRITLFRNPALERFYKANVGTLLGRRKDEPLAAPLSGEDFFVTEEILLEYAIAANAFFEEVAEAFEALQSR